MTTARKLSRKPTDQLLASPLAPYVGVYEGYLGDRGYAPSTQEGYLRCLVHFGRWMSQCALNAEDLDEEGVAQFLDEHLPHCQCPAPVAHRREDLRAARGHLLVVLRANTMIPEPVHGPHLEIEQPNFRVIDLGTAHTYTALPALIRYLRRERPEVMLSDKDRVNRTALAARFLARTRTRILLRSGTTLSVDLASRGAFERWPQKVLHQVPLPRRPQGDHPLQRRSG